MGLSPPSSAHNAVSGTQGNDRPSGKQTPRSGRFPPLVPFRPFSSSRHVRRRCFGVACVRGVTLLSKTTGDGGSACLPFSDFDGARLCPARALRAASTCRGCRAAAERTKGMQWRPSRVVLRRSRLAGAFRARRCSLAACKAGASCRRSSSSWSRGAVELSTAAFLHAAFADGASCWRCRRPGPAAAPAGRRQLHLGRHRALGSARPGRAGEAGTAGRPLDAYRHGPARRTHRRPVCWEVSGPAGGHRLRRAAQPGAAHVRQPGGRLDDPGALRGGGEHASGAHARAAGDEAPCARLSVRFR